MKKQIISLTCLLTLFPFCVFSRLMKCPQTKELLVLAINDLVHQHGKSFATSQKEKEKKERRKEGGKERRERGMERK